MRDANTKPQSPEYDFLGNFDWQSDFFVAKIEIFVKNRSFAQ